MRTSSKLTGIMLKQLLPILGISICFVSCQTVKDPDSRAQEVDSSEATIEEVKEEPAPPPPVDRGIQDLALFLAGMPSEEGSEYANFETNAAWQQYSASAQQTWSQINSSKVPAMAQWRDNELKALNEAGGTVFYPFSGPDFLHASIFFPEADTLIMIGLEPAGSLPKISEISQKSLGAYFNGIRRSLSTILRNSFFRTIAMAQDFTGKVVSDLDGTLPNLLLFMARTDHRALYYSPVRIMPDGSLVTISAEEKASLADSIIVGTRIDYRREDYPEERKVLYYFQMNLDNNPYQARSGYRAGGLNARSDVYGYLQSLPIQSTYIKSASYLMYRDNFAKIRNVILDQSQYLLQDDSGMPIQYVDPNKWERIFYGSYYSPIPLFKIRYQADLRAVYQSGKGVRPLPFGIGYQFQPGTSNLMLAIKK